jgi:hypothetical protein
MQEGGTTDDWLGAMKDGEQAGSNFDYGGPLAEIAQLGIVAMKMLGQKLDWDGENMHFANSREANEHLQHPYREGWTV